MRPISVAVPYNSDPAFRKMLAFFSASLSVEEVLVIAETHVDLALERCSLFVPGDAVLSAKTMRLLLSRVRTKYLFLLPKPMVALFLPDGIDRLLQRAESTGAGLIYSDYFSMDAQGQKTLHPLNDYQQGSVRDDFDFGAGMLFSVQTARKALERYGDTPDVRSAGLYDLRLKVSIGNAVHHICEPLYSVSHGTADSSSEHGLFSYVDPRNVFVQKEMEAVFTDYLRRINACLPAESLSISASVEQANQVVASVVIPVLNRRGTIGDAVKSAISQETDFPFNVMVVDNHSIDGTTDLLDRLSAKHRNRLIHLTPTRRDLGIGGCWNEAIHHDRCGRFSVQLDSDDLYSSPHTLQSIVDVLRDGSYAMVIGAYTLVNEQLEQIPPGLIDHGEWTDENGHNNALRINGLGAPRAFDTALMRKIDFLNVSYGEDYAAGLRICRQYRIGRIFESLYLCRRWRDNTDADITTETLNKNNAFKDSIRTEEIKARQKMVGNI